MKFERKKILQIAAAVLIMYLIMRYWEYVVKGVFIIIDVMMPLIVGAIIAYVVNIVMGFYETKLFSKVKGKRIISMIMAYGSIILGMVLVCVLIVPELKSCIEVLVKGLPDTLEKIQKFADDNLDISGFISKDLKMDSVNWEKAANDIIAWFSAGVGNTVGTVIGYVSSIFSVIMNFIMGLIFSVYILADKEHLKNQIGKLMHTYLSENVCDKIFYVSDIFNHSFHSFIVGQGIEAFILGGLCIIGMLIFRFPYAVMIGILIGCTALIPIAGAYIGGAVGVIMIFTESPVKALMFIIFLIVLQQFEGQIIYPKVVGSSIGLPGIWVFAAVIVGGGLFGILGILLGIPLVSAIYQLLVNDLRKRNMTKVEKKEEKENSHE